MLENLVVKNIALIESAEIQFGSSLNVLTGETGAGKSILLDAIGMLLGDRSDKGLIRTGQNECKVVGSFSLSESVKSFFKLYCEKYDLEYQDEILISRTLSLEGKNTIKINGQIATLSMLKELCSCLVNTYGQNENQTIFSETSHLSILDNYAKMLDFSAYKDYVDEYKNLKNLDLELKSFGLSDEDRLREIELLSFQIDEIESADISVEDYEELQIARHKLLNLGKIISNAVIAQNCLSDDVVGSVKKSKTALEQASLYDNSLEDFVTRLDSVQIELDDILNSICDYTRDSDFSEKEQEEIEVRFSLYNALMRKYGNSVEEVLNKLFVLKERLNVLKNADERITELNLKRQKLVLKLSELAEKITEYRNKKAQELSCQIEENLHKLNMKSAKLKFQFETDKNNFYFNGQDKVNMLFSANLGEDLKPLSKIASGGEISRFMLALKSVIASVDDMPTMIFDEIDTGISGVTSEAVAKQMAIIAQNHQVIVVTHSQQIASMADTNFLIEKIEQNEKTNTIISKLNTEQKVFEVARFMSGANTNETALKNAEKLIEEQEEYKSSLKKVTQI